MMLANFNVSEDHSQYVGQVYQKYYARLRHYFLTQLGDVREAEGCVNETFRRFFFFMEEREWEAEAEYIFVYLMRIAGLLCSRKLGEMRSQRAARLYGNGRNSLFDKVRAEVAGVMKGRSEFIRSILRPLQDGNKQSSFSGSRPTFSQRTGLKKVA